MNTTTSKDTYLLTEFKMHKGGKCIVVEAGIIEEITNQWSVVTLYIPLSQLTKTDEGYECPSWLINSQCSAAAARWVSNYGNKGIDHLSGSVYSLAVKGMSEEVVVGFPSVKKAYDKLLEGRR